MTFQNKNRNLSQSKPAAPAKPSAFNIVLRIGFGLLAVVCIACFAVRVSQARIPELIGYGAGGLLSIVCVLWLSVARAGGQEADNAAGAYDRAPSQAAPLEAPAPLPPVHTLVTVSPDPASDSSSDELQVVIDPIFFDRLDEYKSYRPSDGCVVLITETIPPAYTAEPVLNGAMAAMSAARMVAQVRGMPILLIDTGSPAWSVFGVDSPEAASDTIPLPDSPGVYEILANREQLVDCILAEDELPGLTAIAPGVIPPDWPDRLSSHAMRTLVASSRTAGDLIMIYAPRCLEYPDAVRALSAWCNCVMLISVPNPVGREYERSAVKVLSDAGALIFGRIELEIPGISSQSGPEATQVMRAP